MSESCKKFVKKWKDEDIPRFPHPHCSPNLAKLSAIFHTVHLAHNKMTFHSTNSLRLKILPLTDSS